VKEDVKHLPSMQNVYVGLAGGALAVGASSRRRRQRQTDQPLRHGQRHIRAGE
jgi:hypothetical protein